MGKKVFFVYFDKTDDGRIFYIGKGLKERLSVKERNKYWKNIVQKYGWYREVIFATLDERVAFELEAGWIKEYKTFEAAWSDGSGWGANFTLGGDGPSGRTGKLSPLFGKPVSLETRKKISKNSKRPMLGKTGKAHPAFGLRRSMETAEKLSISKMGEKNPWFGKTGSQTPMYGKHHSDKSKKKLSENHSGENGPMYGKVGSLHPNFGKIQPQEWREQHGKDISGEKNGRALLTLEQVKEIREKYATGDYFQRELAEEYGVRRGCISGIISGKNWKNI